jgi:hypothetical protein
MRCLAAARTTLRAEDFGACRCQYLVRDMISGTHTLYIEIPSPSNPTATSVRFRFFMPLILHTLAACARPLVEPMGFDRVANVKGAPMLSLNDMMLARPVRGGLVGLRESLRSMRA